MKSKFTLWIGLSVTVIICLWTAFAQVVVPPLIKQAYQGQSFFPFLNTYFAKSNQSLENILSRWYENTNGGIAVFLFCGLIVLLITRPSFFRKYVKSATPDSLGTIRILVCGILLFQSLAFNLVNLSIPHLPEEIRAKMGLMWIFYALPIGFGKLVENEILLQIFCSLTALTLFLGMIGWRTKIVLPLGVFFWLIQAGIIRQYSYFFHTGILPLYLLAVLSFTPCADGLSVDRLRKINRGEAVPIADSPSPVYGWSRYACWTVIAAVYVMAGINKIRLGGLFWWSSSNMRAIIYHGTLEDKLGSAFAWDLPRYLTEAPDVFYAFLGISGIVLELAYLTVLFSPTARRIVPILGITLHISILFLQKIAFLDLIALQLIFFDLTKISQAIQRSLPVLLASKFLTKTERTPSFPFQKTNPTFFYTLVIFLALNILLLAWAFRLEFYPFTTWQMFATTNNSGEITYYRTLIYDRSGTISRINFKNIFGSSVYRYHVRNCFKPQKIQICQKFLDVSAANYQNNAPADKEFKQFEIQQWKWNFQAHPQDPQRGEIVARFIYPD